MKQETKLKRRGKERRLAESEHTRAQEAHVTVEAQGVLALPLGDRGVAAPGAVRHFRHGHSWPHRRRKLRELQKKGDRCLANWRAPICLLVSSIYLF